MITNVTNDVELARRALVQMGMRPFALGRRNRKNVEFVSYPWQAGKELFVLVREPNKPTTVECVEVDEVKPLGEQK